MSVLATGAPRHAAASRSVIRPLRSLRAALVWSVGLLGACALLVVVLPLFGARLTVLATGSMAPALPAGSVVLSHAIPAAQAQVGDVVTVLRDDGVPVTHRVESVAIESGLLGLARLELRGDANASADPRPYLVRDAHLVVASVPWGGQLVLAARSPIVLGVLSVVLALLVLWSWWPERPEESS